jgi:hypothetical protein
MNGSDPIKRLSRNITLNRAYFICKSIPLQLLLSSTVTVDRNHSTTEVTYMARNEVGDANY